MSRLLSLVACALLLSLSLGSAPALAQYWLCMPLSFARQGQQVWLTPMGDGDFHAVLTYQPVVRTHGLMLVYGMDPRALFIDDTPTLHVHEFQSGSDTPIPVGEPRRGRYMSKDNAYDEDMMIWLTAQYPNYAPLRFDIGVPWNLNTRRFEFVFRHPLCGEKRVTYKYNPSGPLMPILPEDVTPPLPSPPPPAYSQHCQLTAVSAVSQWACEPAFVRDVYHYKCNAPPGTFLERVTVQATNGFMTLKLRAEADASDVSTALGLVSGVESASFPLLSGRNVIELSTTWPDVCNAAYVFEVTHAALPPAPPAAPTPTPPAIRYEDALCQIQAVISSVWQWSCEPQFHPDVYDYKCSPVADVFLERLHVESNNPLMSTKLTVKADASDESVTFGLAPLMGMTSSFPMRPGRNVIQLHTEFIAHWGFVCNATYTFEVTRAKPPPVASPDQAAANWRVGEWGPCPGVCLPKPYLSQGTKTREVVCVTEAGDRVDESRCGATYTPLASDVCGVKCDALPIPDSGNGDGNGGSGNGGDSGNGGGSGNDSGNSGGGGDSGNDNGTPVDPATPTTPTTPTQPTTPTTPTIPTTPTTPITPTAPTTPTTPTTPNNEEHCQLTSFAPTSQWSCSPAFARGVYDYNCTAPSSAFLDTVTVQTASDFLALKLTADADTADESAVRGLVSGVESSSFPLLPGRNIVVVGAEWGGVCSAAYVFEVLRTQAPVSDKAAMAVANWRVGEFGACTGDCANGGTGSQTREVVCVIESGEAVDESRCTAVTRKPVASQTCQTSCDGINNGGGELALADSSAPPSSVVSPLALLGSAVVALVALRQ